MRFIQNLLPLLISSTRPHIVNIHGAGNEGRLIVDDLELKHNFSLVNAAIHTNTMNTLAVAEIAPSYPSISFIHVFPGLVITGGFANFAEEWPPLMRFLFMR